MGLGGCVGFGVGFGVGVGVGVSVGVGVGVSVAVAVASSPLVLAAVVGTGVSVGVAFCAMFVFGVLLAAMLLTHVHRLHENIRHAMSTWSHIFLERNHLQAR